MKINAAVRYQPKAPVVLEEVDLVEPQPDEVLVKIVGVGVCHTDLFLRDLLPAGLPAVLGHEGSGIVEQVGSAVTKVAPGDHVVLSVLACGYCPACLTGRPMYCVNFEANNTSGTRANKTPTLSKNGEFVYGNFFGQSSWANFALANQRNTVKVTKDVPIEMLGPLGCGIQTGAGGVINSLNPQAGSSIAIFGAGSVGLSAVMGAVVKSCTKIIAVDVVPARLEAAKKVGATHTVNAKETDPVQAIKDLTGYGADYVVECTGIPAVQNQAVLASAPQWGETAMIGVGGAEATIKMSDVLSGRVIRGVMEGDSVPDIFIPQLIELYQQGRFPFDKLITYYSWDKFNQAIEDGEHGVAIKAVVKP